MRRCRSARARAPPRRGGGRRGRSRSRRSAPGRRAAATRRAAWPRRCAPSATAPARGRAEAAVEVAPAVDGPDDRVERHDRDASRALADEPERGDDLLVGEDHARRRPARRAAAPPPARASLPAGAQEVVLRVEPGHPGRARCWASAPEIRPRPGPSTRAAGRWPEPDVPGRRAGSVRRCRLRLAGLRLTAGGRAVSGAVAGWRPSRLWPVSGSNRCRCSVLNQSSASWPWRTLLAASRRATIWLALPAVGRSAAPASWASSSSSCEVTCSDSTSKYA